MKKTGIICAIDQELKPYLDVLEGDTVSTGTMLTFHEGTIEGASVVAVVCGICKVNAALATQILIDKYGVDRIIMSGTAGGLDKRLAVGDTVIATEMAYHDVADEILTQNQPHMADSLFRANSELLSLAQTLAKAGGFEQKLYFGRIVTGEAFIDMDGRDRIIEKYAPLCVDMETAAAAHVCYVNETPFIAVRSISDTEEEHGMGNFEINCDRAAVSSFKVVRRLLREVVR